MFSIPVGVLYCPSESKLKNSKTKDYMGKARLVAASDADDQFTTFTGSTRLKSGLSPSNTFVRRPDKDMDSGPGLNRSLTAPAARNDARGGADLGRSRTVLNVPADARERIAGLQAGGPPDEGRRVGRANSATGGGSVRGLSINRKGPGADRDDRPPIPEKPQESASRLTEIYDDYMDAYADDEPPPVPALPSPDSGAKADKISAWARANANPNQLPPAAQRSNSRSAATSMYAPSSFGGSSRRKLTRRSTKRTTVAPSMYNEDEEEEGYGSGDYDDGPFELVKIRVKLHYEDDVRGMALTPETPYEEFVERVTAKFGKAGLGLKFKDEDGGKVSLRDDSDYELAIETAREHARGKPEGKLEIWCTDK